MKFIFVTISLTIILSPFLALANEPATSLVLACKADCPKAKTNDEAHKCAEKKGRLNKEFRKSKCWEINEEYEKKVAAAKTEKKK